MGIAERKERAKEDVRRRILEAAHDLFEKRGYENVTMRAVADAIEYSPTTIYLHFENKDALVEALCFSDFEKLGAALSTGLPEHPVERIRALGRAYAAFGMANPNHYRFMFMMKSEWTKRPDEENTPPYRTYALLSDAVERAMNEGFFQKADVDLVAQMLWSIMHGVVSLAITYRPEQFPKVPLRSGLLDAVIDTTLRGLTARPESR